MAKQDEDGFYFLVDRKKDVIISGGENLYPVQIEDFLSAYPKVHDVAVIGLRPAAGGDRRRHYPGEGGHDLHRERDQPVLHRSAPVQAAPEDYFRPCSPEPHRKNREAQAAGDVRRTRLVEAQNKG